MRRSKAEEVRLEAAVSPELAERFRRVAADHGRSMRSHLRVLIRDAVTTNEARAAKPEPREELAGEAAARQSAG